MEVHSLRSDKCRDTVQVAVFPGGGGIITYCKQQTEATLHENTDTLYIHTLNTASGLRRKLTGLQLAHVLEL